MENKTQSYTLWLPVYKQGDDLGHNLHELGDDAKAFLASAEQYEEAARICRRFAGLAMEKKVKINCADTHHISVSGLEDVLTPLATDLGLMVEVWDDDGEDEDWEDDEGDDSEEDEAE